MEWQNRWNVVQELPAGGQGKVYRVFNKLEYLGERSNITRSLRTLTAQVPITDQQDEFFEMLTKGINKINELYNPANQGALKVLHEPTDARDPERAKERMKREIEAMSEISHPNLLKIIEYDNDEYKWYVSEFHSGGTLDEKLDHFKGNPLKALQSFRPLVEGVAKIHKQNYIHRDIKPQNIFINSSGNLVLGDFGLVYFADVNKTRLSATLENVGSREWMPMWAQGVRIEDLKPNFDVFSLGKVLWSMISGQIFLRAWYFKDEEFDIEKMFPDSPEMKYVNDLLSMCVVERKVNCKIKDANALLNEIDELINFIEKKYDILSPVKRRICKVCGKGDYEPITESKPDTVNNFGLTPISFRNFRIFTCSYCGNVQLFSWVGEQEPEAWREK